MQKTSLISAAAVALTLSFGSTASALGSPATYGGRTVPAIDYGAAFRSMNDPGAACRSTVCGRVSAQPPVVSTSDVAEKAEVAPPQKNRFARRCLATYCGKI